MNMVIKKIKDTFYADPRVLALFRIALGILGMWDVFRRFPLIQVFYSSEGINFRRQVTHITTIKYFSLLDTFNKTLEVQIFFIVTACCFFFLMIGYRTRLFKILAFLGLISIHNAAVILENGGDMVFNIYIFWALFLPLGTAWSIDSLSENLKNIPDNDSSELNRHIKPLRSPQLHLAYIACLIQLSMIYFYNYLNKTGDMWSDGSAVYYMYQLDTFLTSFGNWMSLNMTLPVSTLLTKATVFIEFIAPLFILSPLFQPWLRRVIFILLVGFHFMIGISVGIGLFSWIMIAVLLLLLSSQDIELFKRIPRWFVKRKYIVFYDRDCGFCHLTARIINRLDAFNCITWADNGYKGNQPKNLLQTLETSILVWDAKSNETWTRHKGFSKILSVLPFGFLFSWILIIPGLELLCGFIYDIVAQNRTSISTSMGLAACGLPNTGKSIVSERDTPIPITQRFNKWGRVISNIMVVFILLGSVDYSIQINNGPSFQTGLKEKVSAYKKSAFLKPLRLNMKHMLLYPRMYQKWSMFSPSVLRTERWITADILFENGERISLFKNSDELEENINREYLQPYQNQFWRKLFSRINKSNYKKYIPIFKKWLKRTDYFPEYKGRKVKSVKLWELSETSPKIESSRPSNVRKNEVVSGKNKNSTKSKNKAKGKKPDKKKKDYKKLRGGDSTN